MELIDPTSELAPETRQPLPRLVASNIDVTIGLLDISKPKGDVFLNRVEDLLQQRGIKTRRFKKPTFTRVAPDALRQEIAQSCDAVVEALAD